MKIDDYPVMCSSKKEYTLFCLREKEDKHMDIRDLHNKRADQILEMSDQQDAVPVNLRKILKVFNLSAMPSDFSQLNEELSKQFKDVYVLGAFLSSGDNAAIFYNHNDAEDSHRYRFTIAHELAHCCLQGEDAHIEFRIAGAPLDQLEITANTFAGELLIPENSLKRVISRLIMPSLHILADIFEVSENVMRARLDFLGLKANIIGYNC